jgi:hypothetical protein
VAPIRPSRKVVTILLLIALVPLLSGCIFLRLNAFRKQMANFKDNAEFKIENRHPVVYFTNPVLQVSDISWLGGEPPSTTLGEKKKDYTATWQLIKLYPQERIPETENFDMDITLNAKDKKVYRMEMPVRFKEILNEQVMGLFFDKADEADIEKKQTSAEWSMANSQLLPSMSDIMKVCGHPYNYESTATEISITYKYHLVPPVDAKDKKANSVDVDATMTYTNPNKSFLRSKVTIGKIHFTNIGDGKGSFKVKIRRK